MQGSLLCLWVSYIFTGIYFILFFFGFILLVVFWWWWWWVQQQQQFLYDDTRRRSLSVDGWMDVNLPYGVGWRVGGVDDIWAIHRICRRRERSSVEEEECTSEREGIPSRLNRVCVCVCCLVQTHMTQKVRSKGGRITIFFFLFLSFLYSFEQFRVLLNASSAFFFFFFLFTIIKYFDAV